MFVPEITWLEAAAEDADITMEDEHHFLFDCPAYSSTRASHANLFQCACSVSDFLTVVKQRHMVDSVGTVFP